ncbi:MAG: Gfo/Idh/MocA family oxidoreductase [Nitriliruptor sp.]|uniref:Gfo/Idh/MocA family protein n=1 Tax=Nitriliruptor sp. TaxID=2448056 RepID=UPI0034A07AD8
MTRTADGPIRWAIVATGGIASSFAADLHATADAEVVAVASRTEARARAFADERGIDRAYGDVGAMLDDGDIDVVYVATPHPQHTAPTRLALEAGVAVLCEKPLAADPAEAAALVALARELQVFLAEAMWMRCDPLLIEARQLVADGAIGELRVITADLGFPAPYDADSRLWAPELGGGALLDVGVYPVAFARTFLSDVPELVGVAGALAPTGVDADATVLLAAGAVQARLSCSLVAPLPSTGSLVGTAGELRFDAPVHRPARRTLVRPGQAPQVTEAEPHLPAYAHEIAEVHACLRSGRTESTLIPLDESLEVLTILDEARRQLGAR